MAYRIELLQIGKDGTSAKEFAVEDERKVNIDEYVIVDRQSKQNADQSVLVPTVRASRVKPVETRCFAEHEHP